MLDKEMMEFDEKVMREVQKILLDCRKKIDKKLDKIADEYAFDLAYWGHTINLSFELRPPTMENDKLKVNVSVNHESIYEEREKDKKGDGVIDSKY